MKENTLNLVCCLVCRNNLVLEKNSVAGQKLLCSGCSHEYKITKDGIPLLVVAKQDIARLSNQSS